MRVAEELRGTSASFKVSLDSVGEGLLGAAPSSSSFEIASGFGAAYPPPGEVGGLRFLDKTTLEWSPEGSAGSYNLYRNLQSALPGSGSCLLQDMTAATTTDGNTPPAGDGYAYLVTVANRLGEEGSKGLRSDGMERGGAACP